MATLLTPVPILGPYPLLQPAAHALEFPMVAADAAGNTFPSTGKEILIIQNPTVGALTVTVTSVADALHRSGDITAYSIPAADFIALAFIGDVTGWVSAGKIAFLCSAATLLVAVLRIPG